MSSSRNQDLETSFEKSLFLQSDQGINMKTLLFNFFNLCISIFFTIQLTAQPAGMRVYTGIVIMNNQNDAYNPSGTAHTGYTVGADGRLFSGSAAFVLSGRYTSVSKIPTAQFLVNGDVGKLNIMNGRVGLENVFATVFKIVNIRGKALASFDVLLSETGDAPPLNGTSLNGGWLGIVGGLGVDVGPIVFDLEYEYGIINAYNQIKDANFNSWSITAGFFF